MTSAPSRTRREEEARNLAAGTRNSNPSDVARLSAAKPPSAVTSNALPGEPNVQTATWGMATAKARTASQSHRRHTHTAQADPAATARKPIPPAVSEPAR